MKKRAIDAGKDKMGAVTNVVDGKPQLLQRTFAKWLTARWFSRNFESHRNVLERILLDPEYGFVKYMFDRMLQKIVQCTMRT